MRSISLFYIALCAILLNSCVQESVSDLHPQTKNVITFTIFNSSAPTEATRATRAADDMLDNEKVINRIDIFFFDATGGSAVFYPDASQITIENSRVTIRVPEDIMEALNATGACKVYVLANCQLERTLLEGKTLNEIKQLSMNNVDAKKFNQNTPPVDFLMDSEELDVTFNAANPPSNLGKVSLRRAAAKVVVDITGAKITGYTPMEARVMAVNYLDQTKLGSEYLYDAQEGDYKSATKTLIANNDASNSFSMNPLNPVYTYANDWAANNNNETYLLIAIDWRKQTDGVTKTYYYRIPFSYIRATGDVDANKDKIRRNYLYQFAVNVTRLGGLDPADAVDVSANFDLLDWSTKKVQVSILEYHFLFVYHPNVEIYNRDANVWEYKSSKQPIIVTMTKVYCNEYDTDGGINERIYTSGDPQYPTVTESKVGDRTYFTFQSMIPVNYVPLYIMAKVTNGTGLSANVSLTIYPKIYVTASYSYGGYANQMDNPDDRGIIPANRAYQDKDGERIWLAGSYITPGGTFPDAGSNNPNGNVTDVIPQKNFNFFTVHVTSLDIEDEHSGMTIGDPTTPLSHKGSTVGAIDNRDAVVTGYNVSEWSVVSPYYQTQTDRLHNKVVSPQFVIATQRGITLSTKSWEVAQQRCATYRESQYAAGSWRMPTLSELKIVRRIQLDPNSAIKELFQSKPTGTTNFGWWTAEYGSSIILGESNDDDAIRVDQPQLSNSVRCVRDLWRD